MAAAMAMRCLLLIAFALRTASLQVSRRHLLAAAPAPLAALASPAVASGDARAFARQGMTAFEKGEVEESIKLFDAAEEADPRYATRLWQRGLSYYYADRFKDARKQFLMDVAENPNDTEEAVWHLLAMARTEGLAKARPQMIKMGRDPRRVMRTVEEAFRNGDAESIGALEAIATDGGAGWTSVEGEVCARAAHQLDLRPIEATAHDGRLAQPEPLTLAASGCVTVAQPDGPELGGGPRELGPESGRAAGSSLRLPCTGALANMMVHSDPALRIMAYARLLGGDEMGVARGACAVRDALAGLTTDRVKAAVRALACYVRAGGSVELIAEAGDARSAMLLASAVRAAAGDRDLPALSLEEAADAMRRARIRLSASARGLEGARALTADDQLRGVWGSTAVAGRPDTLYGGYGGRTAVYVDIRWDEHGRTLPRDCGAAAPALEGCFLAERLATRLLDAASSFGPHKSLRVIRHVPIQKRACSLLEHSSA